MIVALVHIKTKLDKPIVKYVRQVNIVLLIVEVLRPAFLAQLENI
jgi:hypothetical protein